MVEIRGVQRLSYTPLKLKGGALMECFEGAMSEGEDGNYERIKLGE